jgi:hypothetical protein
MRLNSQTMLHWGTKILYQLSTLKSKLATVDTMGHNHPMVAAKINSSGTRQLCDDGNGYS